MEDKKKRGCNYTLAEKEILLELVKKYQDTLENKETNATLILKKRTAWESVCQQYNAVAVSGSRSWQQLRHLYENLKQRSKKNIAEANRLHYYEKTKEVLKKASLDKTEIKRTGGGSYKSILTEQDAQILAMVAPQIQPLSNPFDDAAIYFGEVNKEVENEELIIIDNNNTDVQNKAEANIIRQKNMPSIDPPCTIVQSMEGMACTIMQGGSMEGMAQYIADEQEATKTIIHQNNRAQTLTSDLTGRAKPIYKNNKIKQIYFKAKLRNAKLESKFLINKNKMEINKYKIEMEILQLKLKKLKCLRF